MKTYRVWAKMTSYCYLDVEADSVEEANEIAMETDGGDFMESDNLYDGDWEILQEDTTEL